MVSSIQAKFATTRTELAATLIERDVEVDIVLTAMISRENPLFVGEPGTAKSLLLDSVMSWMNGSKYTVLFTKYTAPEEIFGQISVVGLTKEDKYRRISTGKLPEADVAFGDEIFKASSAILNTLLRILNERVYDNGDGKLAKVPLKVFVAASNEWPQAQDGGKELSALFDRFLFRQTVQPIRTAGGEDRLLWVRDHTPKLSTTITPAEIDQAHEEAKALPWSPEAKNAFMQILREVKAEGIRPGDRRKFKSVMACQAFAYLSGASKVEPEHMEILSSVLWEDPTEQPAKVAAIVAKIANPTGMLVNSLLIEAEQIIAATNIRNLVEMATAAKKLSEIISKLSGMKSSDARVVKANEYVSQQLRKLKLASLDVS